ncbi:uncharacterized protein BDR25DRAFT_306329 [Lindgomyces ingoldianus]|uniref:Uncharacterized protein n=1 Tax=Lindgomyces ingoldianus TaxID=673940 RepID=A0ACB6QJ44_9PLEO|nr:uncharacterized protein BDR25DRAFT_306329 [Lindgomyces ingoldianus]KAF2466160.1 hypothetical protein BDR25DRAFT_306329 [Lindgomyces ingoldianus]
MAKEPLTSYVAPPSTGHEIGVIFGFIGFMVLCMITYGFVWQIGNKRSQKKEADRIAKLRASGLMRGEKEPNTEPMNGT